MHTSSRISYVDAWADTPDAAHPNQAGERRSPHAARRRPSAGVTASEPVASRIFVGGVSHTRLQPVRHAFYYPLYFYGFDLDELPALARRTRWFGHNRRRPIALHDADYLEAGPAPLREKLFRLLAAAGCADDVASVELITGARFFNYVFNPVSFFLCRRPDGALRCVVAEVHNTFGEKHLYVLPGPPDARPGRPAEYRHTKEFHVSPFNNMAGEYRFRIDVTAGMADICVDMIQDGQVVFLSRLSGTAAPMSGGNLAGILWRFPLSALLTVPRILGQAARLYFQKRLPVLTKPEPASPRTTRYRAPSLLDRMCMRLVFRQLRRWNARWLTLRLPDGREVRTPGADAPAAHTLWIKNYRFFRRLVWSGDVGFGDSYMFGEWTCDRLAALLTRLAATTRMDDHSPSGLTRLGRIANRIRHLGRPHTRRGSRRNIEAHYDLSNEFYRLFLDETLAYSCACYQNDGDTLDQAQRNKYARMIERADVRPGDHLLEIGSGWGGLALEAVRQTGCRVTTLTLSGEQKRLADERIRAAGLQDRIEVRLQDYRDVRGAFDAIVSVEMLEAVGHDQIPEFFAVCDRVLKPGGRLAVQVITIPDARYERYRRGCDWIQKRIFPGGHLPSAGALREAMARASRFRMEKVEDIGPHYARTLAEWRNRFLRRLPEVRALGFDENFIRMWAYYLAYCEAGFATGQIQDLQFVCARPGESRPPAAARPRAARANGMVAAAR
jgi:cyclopropane-fatty-acyl-phospholipid synthase